MQKKQITERSHAHEALRMVEGNSYAEASLGAVIVEKFGEHQRFYTCSADNIGVDELTGLPKRKGKFMSADEEFVIDINKIYSHWFSVAGGMVDKPIGQSREEMLTVVDHTYRFS